MQVCCHSLSPALGLDIPACARGWQVLPFPGHVAPVLRESGIWFLWRLMLCHQGERFGTNSVLLPKCQTDKFQVSTVEFKVSYLRTTCGWASGSLWALWNGVGNVLLLWVGRGRVAFYALLWGHCFLWEPWLSGHFQIGSVPDSVRNFCTHCSGITLVLPKFSTNSVVSQETLRFFSQKRTFKQKILNTF